MSNRQIAVFSTSHIFKPWPCREGQEPMATSTTTNGSPVAYYSSGQLEEALAQGYATVTFLVQKWISKEQKKTRSGNIQRFLQKIGFNNSSNSSNISDVSFSLKTKLKNKDSFEIFFTDD